MTATACFPWGLYVEQLQNTINPVEHSASTVEKEAMHEITTVQILTKQHLSTLLPLLNLSPTRLLGTVQNN